MSDSALSTKTDDLPCYRYFEKMDLIQAYMRHHKFPTELRGRIRVYFKRYFTTRSALDESAVLNDLNPDLQREVSKYLLHDVVRKNPIFLGLDDGQLTNIVVALRPMMAEAEQELMHEGELSAQMYMLVSGSLELTNEAGYRETLFPGASEGELGALGLAGKSGYKFTIKALELSELYVLSAKDMIGQFANMPDVFSQMRETAVEVTGRRNRARLEGDGDKKNGTPSEFDGEPVMNKQQQQRKRSTLMGSGGATLPSGFADTVLDSMDETFDVVVNMDRRQHKLETTVAELKTSVQQIHLGLAVLLEKHNAPNYDELMEQEAARHRQRSAKTLAGALNSVKRRSNLGSAVVGSLRCERKVVELHFAAADLRALCADGTSDPYLVILQEEADEPFESNLHTRVLSTEVARNTQVPIWSPLVSDTDQLCGGNMKMPLILQVRDNRSGGAIIGCARTTLNELHKQQSAKRAAVDIELTQIKGRGQSTLSGADLKRMDLNVRREASGRLRLVRLVMKAVAPTSPAAP